MDIKLFNVLIYLTQYKDHPQGAYKLCQLVTALFSNREQLRISLHRRLPSPYLGLSLQLSSQQAKQENTDVLSLLAEDRSHFAHHLSTMAWRIPGISTRLSIQGGWVCSSSKVGNQSILVMQKPRGKSLTRRQQRMLLSVLMRLSVGTTEPRALTYTRVGRIRLTFRSCWRMVFENLRKWKLKITNSCSQSYKHHPLPRPLYPSIKLLILLVL